MTSNILACETNLFALYASGAIKLFKNKIKNLYCQWCSVVWNTFKQSSFLLVNGRKFISLKTFEKKQVQGETSWAHLGYYTFLGDIILKLFSIINSPVNPQESFSWWHI